jgi:hypothetical protein
MVWDQGQLLDIVAIAHPACLCVARRQVVAEDVTVVPEILNDSRGTHVVVVRRKAIPYNRIKAAWR